MFMCCTKRSSVINLIYSGQQHFSYKTPFFIVIYERQNKLEWFILENLISEWTPLKI